MKIGVVYNPFAGSNKHKAEKRRLELERILGNHGVLRVTRSEEELRNVAREFYESGIDILAPCGGDGTNHYTLTAFKRAYQNRDLPLIALLRGGTMNLLESSLGMSGKPEKRLKRLVEKVESGKCGVIPHTLLCVNGKYGYIFGNGVVANFLKEYYRGGDTGLVKAVWIFAKACWAGIFGQPYAKRILAPVKAHVSIGDTRLPEQSFVTIMAATEKECGLGFKAFYRAREERGKFHLLAATAPAPIELIQNLPKFHAGRKVHSDNIYDIVTDHVLVETFEPYYYTIDGEMLNSTKRLEISAGPVVNLLVF